MSAPTTKLFRRYTNLPILLDMLIYERLTIVGYDSWSDHNDRYALDLYKECSKNISFLGAYCVSTGVTETYHQWSVFAGGTSGVCVNFDGERFLEFVNALSKSFYDCRNVEYIPYRTSKVEQNDLIGEHFEKQDVKNIPFLKRKGYEAEKEFRILCARNNVDQKVDNIAIDLGIIKSIVLSPFLPDALIPSVKKAIRNSTATKLKISKSRLTDSKTWKRSLEQYSTKVGGSAHA